MKNCRPCKKVPNVGEIKGSKQYSETKPEMKQKTNMVFRVLLCQLNSVFVRKAKQKIEAKGGNSEYQRDIGKTK